MITLSAAEECATGRNGRIRSAAMGTYAPSPPHRSSRPTASQMGVTMMMSVSQPGPPARSARVATTGGHDHGREYVEKGSESLTHGWLRSRADEPQPLTRAASAMRLHRRTVRR